MSAAAVQRFVASVSVERTCACGATFTVRRGECRILCMDCIEAADERARETRRLAALAAEERRRMRCDNDACRAALLTPAEFCGFCAIDAGLEAPR